MTREEVLYQLKRTGVRQEADFAVPINGQQIKLPYHVVRTKDTISGSDNGKVQTLKIEWTVALFTTNKETAMESVFLKALSGVGRVEVIRFPDGTPYQTTFKFNTNQIIR